MGELTGRVALVFGITLALALVRAAVHGGFRVKRGRRISGLILVTLFVRLLLNVAADSRLLGPQHPLTAPSTLRAVNGLLVLWILALAIQFLEPLLLAWLMTPSQRAQMPTMFRDILRAALLVLVVMGVLKGAFGVSLGSLLTTSAILSAVIGLALQNTLSNLLAGITLYIEKPFEVGDWVAVDDREGKVDQMSWRATRILTFDNDYLIIPNSVLAEGRVVNYSKPQHLHREHVVVGVSYTAPPTKVKQALLRAAHSVRALGVASSPAPNVILRGFEDFSITYDLRYWIEDFTRRAIIQDEIRSRLWYEFRREGIEIPFPIRDVILRPRSKDAAQARAMEHRARILEGLEKVSVLEPLGQEGRELLASKARLQVFGKGEALVEQGEEGDSFFVLLEGSVEVLVRDEEGREVKVATLAPFDYFGEMSLLTGEPRSATVRALEDCVVAVVDRRAFSEVIQGNETILDGLTDKVHERLEANRRRLEEAGKHQGQLPPPRDKGWVRATLETLLGEALVRGLTKRRSPGNVH